MKIMKKLDYKKQGKRNRAMGADFERRTRKDLEEKGWIVSKWVNNVDLDFKTDTIRIKLTNKKSQNDLSIGRALNSTQGKCVPAKASRFQLHGTGFPDFIAYRTSEDFKITPSVYAVIFCECKVNGTLSKIEKEKAQWYLKNNYCSKFFIAYKTKEKNRVKVNYKEVELE